MCEIRFFICEHCGNLIGMIHDAGVPMMCCGQKMTKLEAGVAEASREKHIPVVSVSENTVNVEIGEIEHPMTKEHSILWVYLQTDKGGQRKCLEIGKAPKVSFALADEKPVAVYAYCNLHGLWKADVKIKACELKPLNTSSVEDYVVCKCNSVSYFDILNEIQKHNNINNLLGIFDAVKETTHCSSGCGGCYDKVIAIISEAMSNK